MRMSARQREAMIAHARADHPDECCGVVVARDGAAVAVHPLRNLAASPLRFEVDGLALHRLLTEVEDAGDELAAIYHSHTRSDAHPSQTDVNFAAHWPGVEWIIVGLGDPGGDAVVRSFLIQDGVVREVPVEVADA
jgi:proteasome lid subunit RPN8/RPN11